VITAVDTNVLLDIFKPDPSFAPASAEALRRCLAEGALVACEVVWAEVAGEFRDSRSAGRALDRLGVGFSPLDAAGSLRAGDAWRAYRRGGGRRDRVVADFLIGAHALGNAERLLTRDRGFYRSYFKSLRVLDPSKG
jgi:predicted nucleic acid-binding protein